MVKKADAALIKTYNERRILNLTREHGPVSRIELAKRSHISKVAVSEIINRLDEAGYILEVGKGESSLKGGKRPTLIKLNPDNGYVIGVEIKRQVTRIALANLESSILGLGHIQYKPDSPIDEVQGKIYDQIDHLLAEQKIERDKLISIGIAVPGFIDYRRGRLRFADTMKGWAGEPLASSFQERYQVPVILENDVKVITLGESLQGAGRGYQNLVCLWIGAGIGAGIMINGQIYRGHNGSAGEIGYWELRQHISRQYDLKHLYENQHYLGEILSEASLLNALEKAAGVINGQAAGAAGDPGLEPLLRRAESGDTAIREVLNEYALLLGMVCSNMIKTFDPEMIILCGRVIEESKYLLETVTHTVRRKLHEIPFDSTAIVAGHLQKNAGIKGAIAMALQTLFELPVAANRNQVAIKY